MGKRPPTPLELRLGRNVERCIATGRTEADIANATKGALDQSTVHRIRAAEVSVMLVKLEALAVGVGCEAWELLHNDFNPEDKLLAFPVSSIGMATKAISGGIKGPVDERLKAGDISDRAVHRPRSSHEQSRDKRNQPASTKGRKTSEGAQNRRRSKEKGV